MSTKNFFELFGLPLEYGVNLAALKARYLELQQHSHPDSLASSGSGSARQALESNMALNAAYDTLKVGSSRAAHLLHLAGHVYDKDTATATDGTFLMQQLELRERLQECAELNEADADIALDEIRDATAALEQQWADRFVQHYQAGQFSDAEVCVNHLLFVEKLAKHVDDLEGELLD